jgi:signal transduction histidine kinase
MVFASNGSLIADSRAGSPSLTGDLDPSRTTQTAEVHEAQDTAGETWLYVSRHFQRGMTIVAATPKPRAELLAFFTDELFPPIVRAGLVALLLSIVLALLMTRSITAPLERVSAAARELAGGNLQKIDPEGPAELQTLARTFNEMGDKVVSSQQAQRDFVANVSHELRTPLTSIQGFAQAILDGTAKGADAVGKASRIIVEEAGRMQRLVADLLELARLDAGSIRLFSETFKAFALLSHVSEKFSPMAHQAQVDLKLEVAPELTMDGDFEKLSQVISNLLDNALKFSPAHGTVTLEARKLREKVEVVVTDMGPGIPTAEAKRIFERFYQVDKSRRSSTRGAGLGLSIAHQIVSAHQGTIRVEASDSGARFVIQLPKKQRNK